MRRFYSPPETFGADTVTLGPEETRHLRDVLRLREGEKVRVFDGRGGEWLCEITAIAKKQTQLTIAGPAEPPAPESGLDLTMAVALTKGDRFDLVVQKSVELGVTRLVPVTAARCDVRLKDTDAKLDRWGKIVLEASKQCGRAKLMEITPPAGLEEVIGKGAGGSLVLFSERGGSGFATLGVTQKITALVGPEGGWEDSEIDCAVTRGVSLVTLGGRILRAETAAIVVAGILQHRFGDLN